MIEANEFIPLDIVHPGSILCEELKARRIRQSDFARQIGMTTGRLRYLLKGKISFTKKISDQIEKELGIPSANWMNAQELYDKYHIYSFSEIVMMNVKSEYREYEGLPIEEVVRLELEKNGFDEEDLDDDQMERFKEEMRQRMDGACILDGVLTEIPIYSVERLKRMREKESAEE